ncbi:MAG: 3-hydroxyisobutyrate dehydrogenase [Alphaproteobacteria bacterium]
MGGSRIAFLGLGNMGLPMARNLVAAENSVVGYDVGEAAQAAAVAAGLEVAATAAEAVAKADAVVTMLPAGDAVSQAYCGEGGVLASASPAALLIDSSTIDVATSRQVHAAAAAAGFAMVDAPVSGGVAAAAAGTLTFMVGGETAALQRAEPLLHAMGMTVVHAGPAGNGQAAKICNNLMLGIQMVSVCEAFLLARRLGLEDQALFDIASKASGQCWSLTSYCPVPGPVPGSPANRDYRPGFAAAMMLKDLRLSQGAAAEAGLATPLGAHAAALYEAYCTADGGAADFSGIIRWLDRNT